MLDKTILFLNAFPCDEKRSNLFRKFRSQINCGAKLFSEVYYTSFDETNIYMNKYGDPQYRKILGKTRFPNRNFLVVRDMMSYVNNWLSDGNHVDYLYMRDSAPTLSFNSTLRKLKKSGTKSIVEIPTYPGTNEGKNGNRRLHYWLSHVHHLAFDFCYTNNISLYAVIGEPATFYKGVPAINIQNGLNIDDVPKKKAFEKHENEMHILIVAMLSYWHGYDRLLKGIKEYYASQENKIKVYVHICGVSQDGTLEQLKSLANENNILDYVHFYGYLGGKELIDLFNKCDIACGSLGLYRQNIIVDTTLKVPEYTARGIPFIYATPSSNINPTARYCYKVEENDTAIDILEIISFFTSIDTNTISNEMRKYAFENLDWSNQLRKIINNLEENRK